MEYTNIGPGTHLDVSNLHLNQLGTTLLASNFRNVFKRVWIENKHEEISAKATISERNSGINTDGRSDTLLDKIESRPFSMAVSGSKPEISLKGLKIKNIIRIIFAQININSFQNKFEQLHDFFKNNLDILLITETKLYTSFPSA